ncbi:class I adenylate-forming enzyme family protein [Gordonia humi]
MNTTILRPLSAWTTRRPDELAVACGATSLTWAQLDAASTRAAAELAAEHGVTYGDRVAIGGRPTTEWVVTALGAIKLGAVVCPLNERSGAADLALAVGQTEPTVIVVSEALAAGVSGLDVPVADLDRVGRAEGSQTELAPVPVRGDDPVAVLSTSGSTGTPKGVVFTHESLISSFFEWCLAEPTFLHARALSVSSMAFGAGLLNGFLGPLVLGGSVVYLPEWDPSVALALIRDHHVNHLGATTLFYEQMAAHPDFADADLSSLTIAFTGGNPVTADLIRLWGDKGIGLRQAYGLTESQSHATIPTVPEAMAKPDSVGIGGVLNEFHVVRVDGTECATDEPGEIVIDGPGMAAGYWRAPELTEDVFGGGQAAHRRHRRPRRRRQHPSGRPDQGHHHLRRHQHLRRRTGAGDLRTRRGRRDRGDRGRRPRVRRDARRTRPHRRRLRTDRRRRRRPLPGPALGVQGATLRRIPRRAAAAYRGHEDPQGRPPHRLRRSALPGNADRHRVTRLIRGRRPRVTSPLWDEDR